MKHCLRTGHVVPRGFDPNHYFKGLRKPLLAVNKDPDVKAKHACPEENGGCKNATECFKACGQITADTARFGFQRGICRAWVLAMEVRVASGGTEAEYLAKFHKGKEAVIQHCFNQHSLCSEWCPFKDPYPGEEEDDRGGKSTTAHNLKFVTCKAQQPAIVQVLKDYFCDENMLKLFEYSSNSNEAFNAKLNRNDLCAKGGYTGAKSYLTGAASTVSNCGELCQVWRDRRDGVKGGNKPARQQIHLDHVAALIHTSPSSLQLSRRARFLFRKQLERKDKAGECQRLTSTNRRKTEARTLKRMANMEHADGPMDPHLPKYKSGGAHHGNYRTLAKSRSGKASGSGGTYQKAARKKYYTKNMVDQIQVWLGEYPGLTVFDGMRFLKASRLKADVLAQYEMVEAAVNDALGAQADGEEASSDED